MSNASVSYADRPEGEDRSLPPLKLLHSYNEAVALMEHWIRQKGSCDPLRILEAGCGNKWPLQLHDIEHVLSCVDVDRRALEIRRAAARAQDEVLYGDLRTADLFRPGQFDVIYNSFVLEHVAGAEQVMDNFMRWLAPGGLLILRIPDRDSVYGFLTRITPFWFHVLIKKYVQKVENAGKPGYDPYPTHHDPIVSRRAMHEYCRARGHIIKDEAGSANYLPRGPLARKLARTMVRAVALLSFGKLQWRYNNLTLVIQK